MGEIFAALDIFLWDIFRDPPPQFAFKYQNWYLIPCCGLEVRYPTYALKSVKDPGNTFNLAKGGQELCRPWYIFHGIFIETPPQFVFKYQNWYLIPCCGLEVQYPTSVLKSVKDPGNTFNLAKGWQELCRPWYIFHGIFININVDIWHAAVGLRCIIPARHLNQIKTRAIPLT